jgi:hypothetical protein
VRFGWSGQELSRRVFVHIHGGRHQQLRKKSMWN